MMENFRFYQDLYNIEVIAFVIMPNHFHMICNSKNLKKSIQSLKSYTAKEIINQLESDNKMFILDKMKENKKNYKAESNYQVWQEGYHPQQILDYDMLKQKIEYIHYNPVKKNLVKNPEDWNYSSAKYYIKGEYCGIKITPCI